MRRSRRRALVLVGSPLVTAPPLRGTTPVEALTDPDSRFLARLP